MAKIQEPVVSELKKLCFLGCWLTKIAPYRAPGENESGPESSLQVSEHHILQERKIGVFGAISLIINKTVGAGYALFLCWSSFTM